MGLFGGLLKKDSRNLTKQAVRLFKTMVKELEGADELDEAGAEVELKLDGKYLIDAQGNSVTDAGLKLDTPDIVSTIGLDVDANTEIGKEVFNDSTRDYSLRIRLWARRKNGESAAA